MAVAGKIAHTHNNGTKSLTFTESSTFMKSKTQKRPIPGIVGTADYNYAYEMVMAILIVFPVILQTVINLIKLSMRTGAEGSATKLCSIVAKDFPQNLYKNPTKSLSYSFSKFSAKPICSKFFHKNTVTLVSTLSQ